MIVKVGLTAYFTCVIWKWSNFKRPLFKESNAAEKGVDSVVEFTDRMGDKITKNRN